jgi:uncharacterized protein
MFQRLIDLPNKRHFFLFGARNTGKSTLLESVFDAEKTAWFDLLDQDLLARFSQRPNDFYDIVQALPSSKVHVVVDEIQKVPALLDVVQRLMKEKRHIFVLSGSSARKLRRHGANLLAGRAFVYHLYPLSYLECADQFDLSQALQWGTLPEVFDCDTDDERRQFLMAYAHTYLKEEIIIEQLVRDLAPFRRFLEVAAQCNGKIVNYANIARDVKVDDKTVKNYFSILEDTLVGYMLEAYHGSLRKRVQQKPKFYFFDTGVVRALGRLLTVPLMPKSNAFGNAFEHFLINECIKLASYYQKDFRFSYLRTITDQEIDLIIERPGQTTLLIEIKSTDNVEKRMLHALLRLQPEFPNSEAICLSNDRYAKQIDGVLVLPWQQGLSDIFITS